MSIDFDPLETFSVSRRVMKKTKQRTLAFMDYLPLVGAAEGAKVYASLGMAAIDLISKNEGSDLMSLFTSDTIDELEATVGIARDFRVGSFDEYLRRIAIVDVCPVEDGKVIGAIVSDEDGVFLTERTELAKAITEITGTVLELPEREFYVKLGEIDTIGAPGVGKAIDLARTCAPKSVDVYNVSFRHHTLQPE